MASNAPNRAQGLRIVESAVGKALPPGWRLRSSRRSTASGSRLLQWFIEAPDGTKVDLTIEWKATILTRDLPRMIDLAPALAGTALVVAPYLSGSARELLIDRGLNYADATGNLRIVNPRPGLFVEVQGATKDPWPDDDSLRTLRGRAAGRAVRALVDFAPPFGVRELAQRSDVSLGSLSRTLDLLDREGLVTRGPRGSVADLDWEGAIRRWSTDYDFTRSNEIATFLEPRGLKSLAEKLTGARRGYAVTGAFAAQQFAPVAPARQAAIYVDDFERSAARWHLKPTEAGANVILTDPFDPVVFERTTRREGYTVAAPSQVVVDLLTGPGRDPSEGNELIEWMGQNTSEWRA